VSEVRFGVAAAGIVSCTDAESSVGRFAIPAPFNVEADGVLLHEEVEDRSGGKEARPRRARP
jgi:hypothetical protein